MADPSEKKGPTQEDNLLDIDSHYVEVDKKIRRRRIIVLSLSILLVIGLLFFQNIVDLFMTAKKPAGRIEKDAREKMIRMSDAEWQASAAQAKAMLDDGKVQEAQNILMKVLARDPAIAEAHYLAGTTYLRQGRIQSAYDQLRQATALRANYYEAQEKLGEIYLLAGDYKAAKDVSSQLTKGGEYLQDGLLLESEIALAEGNLDQALQKATSALTGSKKAVTVKSSAYLADLYLKKGDKYKADQIIKKLDPASLDSEGLLSIAKFYLGAGNDVQALSFFEQALRRYPQSAEVNYNYGQYLFKKG
ncbi:MAG: tetratricopeptide repeat protein, partial [Syntrophales bacterium LBB04]|nr:tetratricopeptide repeat protein [Syntrophales bacterium LBB04]